MFLRTPINGTRFASVWLGARLLNWYGAGTYELVAHGPPITKDSYYWWSVMCHRMVFIPEAEYSVRRVLFSDKNRTIWDWKTLENIRSVSVWRFSRVVTFVCTTGFAVGNRMFCVNFVSILEQSSKIIVAVLDPPAPVDISVDPGKLAKRRIFFFRLTGIF